MSRPATQHKRAAYPSYKPSGVAWLGDVPEHWEVISVKRRYEIQLGKMLQNKPYSDLDVSVQYIKALHVLWGKVDTSDLPEMWASPTDLKQFNIKSGDLLVCEGGEAGRAGIVDSAPDPCIIQNALHRVRGNGADVRFLQYALKTVGSRGWFDALCNKATIAHFTREKLAELRMPTPTLSEQRAIAAFLDRETARIDTLIEKKRRQIELLQEKRSALISHAVTKGLDPN
ncbi:MAG TPA: restriction endonuclease subunit S, partial [Phycisphaerales bacterium]|nr:restriction endonuclease subunit S [Phycisphaerales bacterium]